MFQSTLKIATVCGLFAAVAMLSSSANAQSGSRLFGGGLGSRIAPAQSFSAPTQTFSAPTQSFSGGSGSRSVQSFAPTQTYQPAAPMPTTQSFSQPQSFGQTMTSQPMMSSGSGCGCSGGSSSYSPAPVYSQPVYTPSNYNPGTVYRPFQSGGGCGCN